MPNRGRFNDLEKERNRYNSRASKKIDDLSKTSRIEDVVTDNMDPTFFSLIEYREVIAKNVAKGARVLELGAGTGENSQPLIDLNCELYLLDISEKSLEFAQKKWGSKVTCVNSNIEDLPFPDFYFDAVVGAGCLSYGDAKKVDSEIFRVLKKKGNLILVDSLNHNPVYKLNRLKHYLFGHRSFSTIIRIPKKKRLRAFQASYPDSQLSYHGKFLWVYKIVKPIIGTRFALKCFTYLENIQGFDNYAFKFIFNGHKSED